MRGKRRNPSSVKKTRRSDAHLNTANHRQRALSGAPRRLRRGAATAAVALNAAAALVVGGVAADLAAGLVRTREILAAGTALTTLSRLAERSAQLAGDG